MGDGGPLLVAGVGSGLVISPNITLTLAGVPVARARVAGGRLQMAQRIDGAAGVAAIGFVFFTVVDGGDWVAAYQRAMLVTVALVGAALLAALMDVQRGRRATP